MQRPRHAAQCAMRVRSEALRVRCKEGAVVVANASQKPGITPVAGYERGLNVVAARKARHGIECHEVSMRCHVFKVFDGVCLRCC